MEHKPLFLFFYHLEDLITLQCFEQLCKIEGAENIQPVSSYSRYLPNTFCLKDHDNLFDHGDNYWMYDGLIYKYVLLNKDLILSKDVVITLEYDTWWNHSLKNWLPNLMLDFDALGAENLSFEKEPEWSFFNRDSTIETGLNKSDLLAIRPLAVTCVKSEYLLKVSDFILNNPVYHKMINCELRFGTLLKVVGARIGEFPFKTIKWHSWINKNISKQKGIFHPIKDIEDIN